DRLAGGELHRTGDADAYAPDRRRAGRTCGQGGVKNRLDLPEPVVRAAGDVAVPTLSVQERSIPVRDGDLNARCTDLCHEQVAGVGAEPQLTGSSAAGGRRQCALLEESGVEQLLHPLRYDRAAETGPSGPTRPGARRTGAHEVQH